MFVDWADWAEEEDLGEVSAVDGAQPVLAVPVPVDKGHWLSNIAIAVCVRTLGGRDGS
jgi:hypothetical protein